MRGSDRRFYIKVMDILGRENKEIKEGEIIKELYKKNFQK